MATGATPFPPPLSALAVRQSISMGAQRKPVAVRKLSRELSLGYAGARFGQDAAQLEILDLEGHLLSIPWEQVKWICYLRDLPANPAEAVSPERLLHKKFTIRPRTPGVWLRLTLSDGDELEGLAANDRTLIEGAGLLLTPPDTRSNTQRIYVPRPAIATLEVLGVVGTAQRVRPPAPAAQPQPVHFPIDPLPAGN